MPPKKDKTVAELREECKKKGITGYSGKTKDELIKLCSRSKKKASKKGSSTSNKKKDKTVAELKEECKKKGITGYSGKKKDELIKLCSKATSGSKGKKKSSSKKKDMTVAELKEECKRKKITGYSGKTKSELIELCSRATSGSGKKSSSKKKSSSGVMTWDIKKLSKLPFTKDNGNVGKDKTYIVLYKDNDKDWKMVSAPNNFKNTMKKFKDFLDPEHLKDQEGLDIEGYKIKWIECDNLTKKCHVVKYIIDPGSGKIGKGGEGDKRIYNDLSIN